MEERIVGGVRGGWLSVGLAAFVATVGCRGGEESRPAEKPAAPSLVVTLSPAAIRAAGIETAPVETLALAPVVTLTGTLAAKPWTSEEQTAISEADSADAKLRLAQANFERLSRLFSEGIVARQDLDTARAARDEARATAAQADAVRANRGLSEASISLESQAKIWGLATLPEVDLPRIKVGEKVEVKTGAFPGQHFAGRVVGVSRSADSQTRNFTVRIAISDPSDLLQSQMLANFAISTPVSPAPTIPRSAVLLEGDGSYVYLQQGTGVFRKQRIQTGASVPDSVQVTDGLSAGQRIVVRGAQILESERLKAGLKLTD
jgi:multidrug efflux pump subunit AcrA (membrane-fusion protein)